MPAASRRACRVGVSLRIRMPSRRQPALADPEQLTHPLPRPRFFAAITAKTHRMVLVSGPLTGFCKGPPGTFSTTKERNGIVALVQNQSLIAIYFGGPPCAATRVRNSANCNILLKKIAPDPLKTEVPVQRPDIIARALPSTLYYWPAIWRRRQACTRRQPVRQPAKTAP
jgi:hypothetical protein